MTASTECAKDLNPDQLNHVEHVEQNPEYPLSIPHEPGRRKQRLRSARICINSLEVVVKRLDEEGPQLGQSPRRVSIGRGINGVPKAYVYFAFRVALHDLGDPAHGFIRRPRGSSSWRAGSYRYGVHYVGKGPDVRRRRPAHRGGRADDVRLPAHGAHGDRAPRGRGAGRHAPARRTDAAAPHLQRGGRRGAGSGGGVGARGAPPPDDAQAEQARAFATLLDGRRIRADLGFAPIYPRLADAVARACIAELARLAPAAGLASIGLSGPRST